MPLTPVHVTKANSLSVTIPSTTAGNCLVVAVASYPFGSSGSVTGITLGGSADNFGQLVSVQDPTFQSMAAIWADPDCAGGQTAIVISGVNLNVGSTDGGVTVYEVPGLALSSVLDQSSTGDATSGSTFSSGTTGTTTEASEIFIGAATASGGITGPSGGGWTDESPSGGFAASGYQVVSSTGTAVYSGFGSGAWAAAVVTLKSAIPAVTSSGSLALAGMALGGSGTVGGAVGGLAMAGMALAGSGTVGPGFPDAPLDLAVELLLSGTWTDVTPWLDHGPVTIGRGHPDESTAVSPSTLAAIFTNTDGRFTSKNPTGPYYGSLGRNVPCRVSIPAQSPYLRFEDDTVSYVSAPDSAGLSVTGDTEIQLDLQLSTYVRQVLAAKWAAANQQSWVLELQANGTLTLYWSSTGSDAPSVTSSVPVPVPAGRIAIKATLAVASGTVTFWTAPAIGGTWTQLGAAASGTSGASTSVYNSTADVEIGNYLAGAGSTPGLNGSVYAFRLLSGIGGTPEASPDFTAQAPGTASFPDAQGNTWTLHGTAEISDRNYRAHVETADWPQHQDPSGKSVTVPVAGGGLLRRLGQRSEPVTSTIRRAILALAGTLAPVAYWPCEDVAGASAISSGIGGPPMTVNGTASFGADSSFACSAPIPQTGTSVWYGTVPSYTSNGSIIVRFLMNISSGLPDTDEVIRVITNGTLFNFAVSYYTGGALGIAGYNASGTVFDTGPVAFPGQSGPVWVSMELQPGGGSTVNYSLVVLQPGATTGGAASGTFTGTVGNAVACYVNPDAATGTMAIGHITVQSAWQSLFGLFEPLAAWAGETAGNRFARLCGEEGIQFRALGNLAATPAMGPQDPQTLTQLLQECADADRGMWTELRQQLGWGYRTLASLCNQAAAVTVDYNQDHLEEWASDPLEDDQTVINDVTLTQTSAAAAAGSASYRAYAAPGQPVDGGALSVLAPPAGAGTYDQSFSVNLGSTGAMPDLAGWILHLGTVDEPRYPGIVLDLTNRDLAALHWQILGMDLGDRLVLGNPPPWLPPDPVSQLCQQLTEVLWAYQLTVTVTGVPESPYEVALADDLVYGRADTDGAVLASSATSAATSLSVAATTAGTPLWTTSAGDFPFDIAIGGERITVTNITGSASPQTFTVTRSVNGVVKAQPSGAGVRLWFPPVMALE